MISERCLAANTHQGANPDLQILDALHLLGCYRLWYFILLLLQAILHVLDQLRGAIDVLGNGIGHGHLSPKAELQHLRLQMELQSRSLECERACPHRCCILGQRKSPLPYHELPASNVSSAIPRMAWVLYRQWSSTTATR